MRNMSIVLRYSKPHKIKTQFSNVTKIFIVNVVLVKEEKVR